MRNKRLKPIVIFLSLSLIAHISFLFSVWITSLPKSHMPETVEVSYIDADEMNRKVKQQQIVEQQHQVNDEVDEKAKFLSAFDQKVLEETKAEQSGQFSNSAGGGSKPEPKEKVKMPPGELPSLEKLVPSFQNKQISKHQGEGPNDLERSQTDDHLKNVKSGLQTMLSTREFVYYSYYKRIKDQIRQHWEPGVREKVKIIYKQGRNIASARDRVTQVLVVLDSEGTLIRVDVLAPSGIVDLDAAAVEAFESAAPFPNPPDGMVESDGTIKIRWDFVLEA